MPISRRARVWSRPTRSAPRGSRRRITACGRTLSGQTVEAFWASVQHAKPISVGINCALGAREMRPFLADLAAVAPIPVTAYPNAGLPNAFGGYDETPEQTAAQLREFAESG